MLSLALGCEPADDVAPPPVNAGFDYQIGGDYRPPSEVRVVSRDWFAGQELVLTGIGDHPEWGARDRLVSTPGSPGYVNDRC
ncbi:hypothetical protein BH24ACT6_BH24ACT6_09760 [soil metagenome]